MQEQPKTYSNPLDAFFQLPWPRKPTRKPGKSSGKSTGSKQARNPFKFKNRKNWV
jgi:hypothetical protein